MEPCSEGMYLLGRPCRSAPIEHCDPLAPRLGLLDYATLMQDTRYWFLPAYAVDPYDDRSRGYRWEQT